MTSRAKFKLPTRWTMSDAHLIIIRELRNGTFFFKKKLVKPAVKWPWACDEDLFDALLHDNDTRNCAKNHHLCLIMYVCICTSAPTLPLSINS